MIAPPKVWVFFHRAPYHVSALNNTWGVFGNGIEDRIWDKLDNAVLGKEIH